MNDGRLDDWSEVRGRLLQQSRLSDLRSARRLDVKLDMSPTGVLRRLRTQSKLRDACLAWSRLGLARRGPRAAAGDAHDRSLILLSLALKPEERLLRLTQAHEFRLLVRQARPHELRER